MSNLKMLLRQAVMRSKHAKRDIGHVVVTQWLDAEDIVNDFADWLAGSFFEGPVWAYDDFRRRKSKFASLPRPDNYPMPEPSMRLRVHDGYELPGDISVLWVAPNCPVDVGKHGLKSMGEGDIIVSNLGRIPVSREAIPLLYCGDYVAYKLVG